MPDRPRRRVLIVTYYWPPAGGITVLRCLKIAKYLRDHDWEPVIYTADQAQYPYLDPANEADVPEGVTVWRHPITEPLSLFKKWSGRKAADPLTNLVHVRDRAPTWKDRFGIWVRGNFFIPDARALWIGPSVRFLTEQLKRHPVDALFSDGPPHTNTVIALRVKQATGLPWLADFQDPWTQVDYYGQLSIGPRADRKHRRLEQEVFATADRISIASPTWKADLEGIGARNVGVLEYGYDEADFAGLEPAPAEGFTLFHAGLLGYDRHPAPVIEALADLCRLLPGFRDDLRIRLYGEVDFGTLDALAAAGLSDRMLPGGTVPRKRVLAESLSAGLLLLPLNRASNSKGRLPGKLYEYLRAGAPVLALGPPDSDAAAILRATHAGRCFDYDDPDGCRQAIAQAYEAWKAGVREPRTGIEAYSNTALTARVAGWLDAITP